MQAVILAAGKSSRFYPLTNGIHKSMVKICGKPILEHTISGLKKAGIKNLILIVSSKETIPLHFGSGEKFGVSIEYVIQPEPLGAGDGLLLAKDYINGDFLLLNGSHVDINDFVGKLLKSKLNRDKAVLLVKEKKETWNNGVIKIKGEQVEDLVEKPKKGEEPSRLCLVGIYLFSKEFLDELKNTPSEHYQLEKAIAGFARKHFVRAIEIDGETVSLKYPWDLLSLKNYLLKNVKKSVGKNVKIAKSAEIIGDVVIEDGVEILEGAKIKGPCYLGKNAYIGNHAVLRNGADIGEKVVVGAYMEVKNSLVMKNSTTHSGFIGDSVIGKNCKIGAQFCTANVRLDRKTIETMVRDKKVDTGLKSLGMLMGDNVVVGMKSSTMPGVMIGQNSVIGPSTMVIQNVEDNTRYYSKFQEVITKKNKNKIVLFDIDYTLFDTDLFKKTSLKKHAVYKEVKDVLEKLFEVADLGIFSEGELEFQKTKLFKTDIQKYFPEAQTHIVLEKRANLKEVLGQYQKFELFLVDDKLTILKEAKDYRPSIFTIWVKRGIYAKKQEPIKDFKPDAQIKNLEDLLDIVIRN